MEIIPDSCKLVKLKPLLKKVQELTPPLQANIVTAFDFKDEIFEKTVYDQMIDYLAEYDFLYKYQSSS